MLWIKSNIFDQGVKYIQFGLKRLKVTTSRYILISPVKSRNFALEIQFLIKLMIKMKKRGLK